MEREQIKKLAIELVKKHGLINLSRSELCKKAGIPNGSFPHVMGVNFTSFVEELKNEVRPDPLCPVNKSRTNSLLRKNNILAAALDVSIKDGYNKVTGTSVAEAAGVSVGLVFKYFGTMKQLRNAIMKAAIQQEILEIIAQGLVTGDRKAKKVSAELKKRALSSL
jgi:AcrR family transcriptional regulator